MLVRAARSRGIDPGDNHGSGNCVSVLAELVAATLLMHAFALVYYSFRRCLIFADSSSVQASLR